MTTAPEHKPFEPPLRAEELQPLGDRPQQTDLFAMGTIRVGGLPRARDLAQVDDRERGHEEGQRVDV
jgi:hypothetical protein